MDRPGSTPSSEPVGDNGQNDEAMLRPSATVRSRALVGAGLTHTLQGEMGLAEADLEEGARLAVRCGGPFETVRAQHQLAFARVLVNGCPDSMEVLVTGAARALEAPSQLQAELLATLGRARLLIGEAAAAHEQFLDCAEIAIGLGDDAMLGIALVGLGRSKVLLGDYVDAGISLTDGMVLARTTGDSHGEAVAMASLGQRALNQGRGDQAARSFEDAITLGTLRGYPYPVVLGLLGCGRIALAGDCRVQAGLRFRSALVVARSASILSLISVSLAWCAYTEADPKAAAALAAEAETTARGAGDQVAVATAVEVRARLSRSGGDLRGAARCLEEAIGLRGRVGDPAAIADDLDALAAVACEDTTYSAAARMLGAAASVRDRHGCARLVGHETEHTHLVEVLRTALGAQVLEREWGAGAAMSTRAAVAFACVARSETSG